MNRRWLRWVPAVAAPAVIAGALVSPTLAGAAVDLPDKSPEQVLSLVAQSSADQLSGTIEQSSALGLPELPTTGPSANDDVTSALELLTGSHSARVYLDGPVNARVQVMDTLGERDMVRQGSDVWLYSSRDNATVHLTLPADATDPGAHGPGEVRTPQGLAHRLLAALDSTTKVTVGEDTEVAGRTAYDLIMTPLSSATLVGSVSITVDSETGLPLSVSIAARGQAEPAFELAFTSLTLGPPNADLFDFAPPAGSSVKEVTPPHHGALKAPPADGKPQPRVIGTGWDTVVEVPATAVPTELLTSPLLTGATQSVAGGRLISTALVTVFLTDDGRVLAGSVPPDRLQAAAESR
jgi:outer membrane lipoprotein-sorting protein